MRDIAEELEHVLQGRRVILDEELVSLGTQTAARNLRGICKITHVNGVNVTLMEGVHVTVREETVREQGQKNKFRKSEEFIPRESKPCTSARGRLAKRKVLQELLLTGGQALYARLDSHLNGTLGRQLCCARPATPSREATYHSSY